MNRTFHLHLVSDSTGETTHNLARACLVQFENLEVNTLEHSQIQNKAGMDRVLAAIEERPGAVIDVSRKSIEESASEIMEHFSAHNETRAGTPTIPPANEND